jgi:DNA-binding CsgD family transcriptional regulator
MPSRLPRARRKPESGEPAAKGVRQAGPRAARFTFAGHRFLVLSEPIASGEQGAGLTQAEHEVASMVAQGRSNREIAAARNVSPATIANQLQAIYAKLGVGSRSAMVLRARGR